MDLPPMTACLLTGQSKELLSSIASFLPQSSGCLNLTLCRKTLQRMTAEHLYRKLRLAARHGSAATSVNHEKLTACLTLFLIRASQNMFESSLYIGCGSHERGKTSTPPKKRVSTKSLEGVDAAHHTSWAGASIYSKLHSESLGKTKQEELLVYLIIDALPNLRSLICTNSYSGNADPELMYMGLVPLLPPMWNNKPTVGASLRKLLVGSQNSC
jgi:hypothetical protein